MCRASLLGLLAINNYCELGLPYGLKNTVKISIFVAKWASLQSDRDPPPQCSKGVDSGFFLLNTVTGISLDQLYDFPRKIVQDLSRSLDISSPPPLQNALTKKILFSC